MFHEHDVLPHMGYRMMVPAGGKLYRVPEGIARFSLAYSLKAAKP